MTQNLTSFEEADVIFVADVFRNEYAGGAELTTDALLQTTPYKTHCINSSDINVNLVQAGAQKTWVFFNFRGLDHELIPAIVQNLYYFVVEYDYKFCQYRSMDLHLKATGKECDCHNQQIGKIISTFYLASEKTFFMSVLQQEIYQKRYEFLDNEKTSVLSSVFDEKDLEYMENLRVARKENGNNGKYAVVDGNSWIKGLEETQAILSEKNIDFEVLGGLQYTDLLRTLSEYQGLAFLPLGADTCPRLVIEAKLMGLELILNENVQHKDEAWFAGDRDKAEMYLLSGHERFWCELVKHNEREVTLSGYTQAYNVKNSSYPWRESILSLLNFCDEVIVLDGGSSDGTWEELQTMSKLQGDGRLIVKQFKRDWNAKRFALFDGQQKSIARTLCTKEWCWQSDIDEIVHEDDYDKIKKLARQIPKAASMVALPVIEFWGGTEKVRVDINPWKCRLSRNKPNITHGVQSESRRYDESGDLFSAATDGCEYIYFDSYKSVPSTTFYTPDLHQVRTEAVEGNSDALKAYSSYMNSVAEQLPGVYHYSWFDIKRKIHTYKNYWSKHWASIYNKEIEDIPENNMFFNKKWSEVTDKEINDLAERLKKEMGGWIFHEKIDFNRPTPWMKIEKNHPKIMKKWISDHEGEG